MTKVFFNTFQWIKCGKNNSNLLKKHQRTLKLKDRMKEQLEIRLKIEIAQKPASCIGTCFLAKKCCKDGINYTKLLRRVQVCGYINSSARIGLGSVFINRKTTKIVPDRHLVTYLAKKIRQEERGRAV